MPEEEEAEKVKISVRELISLAVSVCTGAIVGVKEVLPDAGDKAQDEVGRLRKELEQANDSIAALKLSANDNKNAIQYLREQLEQERRHSERLQDELDKLRYGGR